MALNVQFVGKDDEIGAVRKKLSVSGHTLETPTKSVHCHNSPSSSQKILNELSRRVSGELIQNFFDDENSSKKFIALTRNATPSDQPTLVFFNATFEKYPREDVARSFGHVIYAASTDVICLPLVKKSTLSSVPPGAKTARIDDKKIDEYLSFQKTIIDSINTKNSKTIIGAVPILAPAFSNKIIEFYFNEGIRHFAIDANTSNIFNNESNLRNILDRININAKQSDGKSIADSYIHGVNLGINNFATDEVSADDFLSLYAYIDTFGTRFKSRGRDTSKPLANIPPPKKKIFIRGDYCYKISDGIQSSSPLSWLKNEPQNKITDFNEKEQHGETVLMHEKIGSESISKYLSSKRAVDKILIEKIKKISKQVRV